jgi:hypothetical protein
LDNFLVGTLLGDFLKRNYPPYEVLPKGAGPAPLRGGIFFPRILVTLIALVIATLMAGCDQPADAPLVDGYVAVSSISRNGFARNDAELQNLQGQDVRLWGFVDPSNLYGDDSAKQILPEWWSGEGPTATTWSFNLKGHPDDAAGQSFSVQVPNDAGRDQLLRAFVADARAQRPTRVFVTGRLFTFDAPTNVTTRQGLYMEVQSSQDVRLEAPNGQ